MALSGSTDWTLSALDIINAAVRKIVGEDITLTTSQKSNALQALNIIVKSLQNNNIFLWSVDWVTKTFSASSEVVGTDSSNYTCIRSHTSASANKPVTGADWSTYWIQIGSSGGVWATSTAYSAIGDFLPDSDTLDVIQAYMREEDTGTDTEIEVVGRMDYQSISDKGATSVPSRLFFDKALTPRIYLHPQPDNADDVLHYQRVKKLQDFDTYSNNPDLQSSMFGYLIWQLAYDLSDEYGLPLELRRHLGSKARTAKEDAMEGNMNREQQGLIFRPRIY